MTLPSHQMTREIYVNSTPWETRTVSATALARGVIADDEVTLSVGLPRLDENGKAHPGAPLTELTIRFRIWGW